MGSDPPTARAWDLDHHTNEQVRQLVSDMIGRCGFTCQDRDDLEQELKLHVLCKQSVFDPGRGTQITFRENVLASKAASMFRHRVAQKRDRRRESDEDPYELPIIDERQAEVPVDLCIDVRAALSSLPKELRPVANLLMKVNESKAARLLNMTRAQVRHRRDRIKEHLKKCGLSPESCKSNNQLLRPPRK
jgi:hypothetical protein